MSKNLLILCDGTGNTEESKNKSKVFEITNIAKLYHEYNEMASLHGISPSLDKEWAETITLDLQKIPEIESVILYVRGIGTNNTVKAYFEKSITSSSPTPNKIFLKNYNINSTQLPIDTFFYISDDNEQSSQSMQGEDSEMEIATDSFDSSFELDSAPILSSATNKDSSSDNSNIEDTILYTEVKKNIPNFWENEKNLFLMKMQQQMIY